jgi:hypothetical protein
LSESELPNIWQSSTNKEETKLKAQPNQYPNSQLILEEKEQEQSDKDSPEVKKV